MTTKTEALARALSELSPTAIEQVLARLPGNQRQLIRSMMQRITDIPSEVREAAKEKVKSDFAKVPGMLSKLAKGAELLSGEMEGADDDNDEW